MPLTLNCKAYRMLSDRKHSESLDELEELRNLVVKEIEGSREIQNTIPN
jgi:hypothetical protein